MPTIVKPNDFVAATTIESAKVNENFDDLFTWANVEAIHKDGTNAFTAIPTLPATNPTSDNQATRKAYTDNRRGSVMGLGTFAGGLISAGAASGSWQGISGLSLPGLTFEQDHWYRVELFLSHLKATAVPGAAGYNLEARLRYGGGVKRAQKVWCYGAASQGGPINLSYTFFETVTNVATMDAQVRQNCGGAADIHTDAGSICEFTVFDLGIDPA